MLYIGVGAGRTTLHFAPYVKEYIGIDYSENMVLECQKRFSQYHKKISFHVCDARNMEMFADNSFDFILFSFNGIDYMSQDDRLKTFKEIKRVGKPGGYFCFSSHNLQGIRHIFSSEKTFNIIKLTRKLIRWLLLSYVYNKNIDIKKLMNQKYTIINDSAHKYKSQTYYIKPIEQIKQLNGYFENVHIYSLNGNKLEEEVYFNSADDLWLYYLCVVSP